MSAESVIRQGRSFNEALMDSECQIGTATDVVDPTSLVTTVTITGQTYAGPCRIRLVSANVSNADVPGQSIARQDAILSLPIDTSGAVQQNQDVLITANDMDPALVGKRFRITGYHGQTFATARRFPVEILT